MRRRVLSLAHLTQAVVEVVLSRIREPQVRHLCSVAAISAPARRSEPEEPSERITWSLEVIILWGIGPENWITW